MFGALKRGRFRTMASLILVVGVLQPKRILAASRGFLAAARLSCYCCFWYVIARLIGVVNYVFYIYKLICCFIARSRYRRRLVSKHGQSHSLNRLHHEPTTRYLVVSVFKVSILGIYVAVITSYSENWWQIIMLWRPQAFSTMSSGMGTQCSIFCRSCFEGLTKSVYPTVVRIMGLKHTEVITMTFQGHATSTTVTVG